MRVVVDMNVLVSAVLKDRDPELVIHSIVMPPQVASEACSEQYL